MTTDSLRSMALRRLASVVLLAFAANRTTLVHAVKGGDLEVQLGKQLKQDFPDFFPRVILDVGANIGDWSRGMRSLYPSSKFLLLEATEKHAPKLSNTVKELGNAKFEIAVLSDEAGVTVKFFQGLDTGNSMFRENTKFYENDVPVERITTTLDIEIEKQMQSSFIASFEEVDFLKLDIQGAELLALKGATKVLEHVTFVQFEASLIEYNENGACFSEIDQLLREHGFVWFDMGDIARDKSLFISPGAGQFDVLYVKPSSTKYPEGLKEAKFCGYRRMHQMAVSETSQQERTDDNRVSSTPSTRGGTAKSASTFDTLDEQLTAALAMQHHRPWVFFALGFGFAILLMFAILLVLKMNPAKTFKKAV